MAAVVQLRTRLPDSEMKKLVRQQCTREDAGLLLNGDADVYRPDGEPLVMLRKGWIGKDLIGQAYDALHHLRTYKTDNRGVYMAAPRPRVRMAGGEISKNTRTRGEDGKIILAASAIVGYFDRQGGRFPYCRTTGFTAKEVAKWETILPMIGRANELLETLLPERYAAQKEACEKAHPAWVIGGTVFSTVTVNNNTVAGTHCDKGDFKKGFGVITCVRRGTYSGGILCFPQYRCGVDLEDGDAILFNPHDWHGMTPIDLQSEDAERITSVYYFREKIVKCGSPEEELRRAQRTNQV